MHTGIIQRCFKVNTASGRVNFEATLYKCRVPAGLLKCIAGGVLIGNLNSQNLKTTSYQCHNVELTLLKRRFALYYLVLLLTTMVYYIP